MRVVIQRVSEARVTIGGQVKGAIERGLLVLVAVEDADTAEDIEWLCGKIVRLRIFSDAEGLMNLSVQDVDGGILVISQFTLFASTKSCLTTKPRFGPGGPNPSKEKDPNPAPIASHIATGSDCKGLDR